MAGWLRLRQVCLAAPHLEASAALIRELLGLEECFRDPAVAEYGLENAVFPLGPDRFLEVVAPLADGTAAGRFLDRSAGRGGYMLIFDCDDPDARVARAEGLGVRLAHKGDHDGFHLRQLHPRDCRACFLEFDRTEGGEALDGPYHPAGPDWGRHVRTEVTRALEGVEVLSADAGGLAAHWGAVMDLPVEARGGAHVMRAEPHEIAVREAPGLERERLDALRLSVRGAAGVLDRARQTGLEVREDAFRLCGMWMRLREAG
ncbi:MAG: VOC family protein [Pseudomonadota bacterium]